jgi:hypothetical protein
VRKLRRREAILIGQTLSHYRIAAALGAGGMGEVYRATDARLGREVALKLLPEAFAFDPERLARFEREAKVLASLNHPGIAHLYGFESATLEAGSSVHFAGRPGPARAGTRDLAERRLVGPARRLDEARRGRVGGGMAAASHRACGQQRERPRTVH